VGVVLGVITDVTIGVTTGVTIGVTMGLGIQCMLPRFNVCVPVSNTVGVTEGVTVIITMGAPVGFALGLTVCVTLPGRTENFDEKRKTILTRSESALKSDTVQCVQLGA
jgi:hypothetical protein